MISPNDFKRGEWISVDGEPWTILDVTRQTPTARGASLIVKAKLRNPKTGAVQEKSFRGGDKVEVPDVDLRPVHQPGGRREHRQGPPVNRTKGGQEDGVDLVGREAHPLVEARNIAFPGFPGGSGSEPKPAPEAVLRIAGSGLDHKAWPGSMNPS